jgi:hypothetical protein
MGLFFGGTSSLRLGFVLSDADLAVCLRGAIFGISFFGRYDQTAGAKQSRAAHTDAGQEVQPAKLWQWAEKQSPPSSRPAACGQPGDETAENVAGKLSLDAQADLLAASAKG